MKKNDWHLPVTVVFIFLGFLLSAQFQTQSLVRSDLSMQKTEDLITMVRNLSEKRAQLEQELESMELKLTTIQSSRLDKEKIKNNLKNEIKQLEIINGTTEVTGSGLRIIIEKDSPILYIDIVYIINELWAAGAEAITVNDIRVNFQTKFFYSENDETMFVTINNKPLAFPIEINAIGNPNTLEKGLTLPGGIIDNLALFRTYPQLEKADKLILPALEQEPIYSEIQYEKSS